MMDPNMGELKPDIAPKFQHGQRRCFKDGEALHVWCRVCKAYLHADKMKKSKGSNGIGYDYICKRHHAESVKWYRRRAKRETW